MAKAPTRKTAARKSTGQSHRAKAETTRKGTAKFFKVTPPGTTDRQHLIGQIQNAAGCSAQTAKATLDAVLGTIAASLKKNQKVQLTGFGTFVVAKRSARKAHNPRTGEIIRAKASKSVRFKPGQPLKRSL